MDKDGQTVRQSAIRMTLIPFSNGFYFISISLFEISTKNI